MRHFDSEALAAFTAVADLGSFTAAAEQLRKTQAAVSISISRFEDRIGKRLFERSKRGVRLTPTGERLIGYARRIHAIESEAISDIVEKVAESRVVLGMPDDYITCFGDALIQRFSPLHPGLYIDLQCRFSRDLEQMVENREMDLAIITQNLARPKGIFLRNERKFFCTGPNETPETKECLSLALFSEECPARPAISTILDECGRPWRLAYSSSHLAGVQLAAASGNLLTVLPEPAIPPGWRKLGPAEGLPELPLLPLALLINKNERLPARQVAAFLRREFGQEPAREGAVAAAAVA